MRECKKGIVFLRGIKLFLYAGIPMIYGYAAIYCFPKGIQCFLMMIGFFLAVELRNVLFSSGKWRFCDNIMFRCNAQNTKWHIRHSRFVFPHSQQSARIAFGAAIVSPNAFWWCFPSMQFGAAIVSPNAFSVSLQPRWGSFLHLEQL